MCRFGRHISVTFLGLCVAVIPVKIRARKNPSGATVYQLDLGLIDGRRVRQTFQNKADAQSALVRAGAKVARAAAGRRKALGKLEAESRHLRGARLAFPGLPGVLEAWLC